MGSYYGSKRFRVSVLCYFFALQPQGQERNNRQNHSNQRLILRFHMSSAGGRTRTLSPERDFKSLVSASLRQSRFSFVVSFYFSLRERFFLREREGFAFFDKMIVSHFSPHVNHVKLFHLVVLDLRSVRGLGRSPCPDALLCCSSAEISPEVIWRDRVRNEYICSIGNNRFIIKPRGWDF